MDEKVNFFAHPMSEEEQLELSDLLDKFLNKQILNADVIERDDNGNIIGYGSHADYDYYAAEVQNGRGYYDNDGHFHRREYNPED